MPTAQPLPAARHSLASVDGSLIATLQRVRLLIRSATSNDVIQSWPLPQDFVAKCTTIKWYTKRSAEDGNQATPKRVLLADGHSVKVFDVEDHSWKASIDGVASNLGQISDVSFGNNPDEILVSSEFGVKLTIWSLVTCRGVEIRDPKIGRCHFDIRPKTGHLAILTRPTTSDLLMLLNPTSHEVIKSVAVGTIDAQEVQWSRDGKWIAIRDTPTSGHNVQIYTADGHLFKTFSGPEDSSDINLGIKRMEWSPAGSLILGDFNGNVTILSKTTFTPMITLHHKTPISFPDQDIWEEQIKANGERVYACVKVEASPPTSSTLTKSNPPKQGISVLQLNRDGTLLATKDDAAPTTVWIWSMQTGKPVTVLIHHSPVKYLSWHPRQNDLLLLHCSHQEPLIHLWKATWIMPLGITLPMHPVKGRLEAQWLESDVNEYFKILLSSQTQTIDGSISLAGDLLSETSDQGSTFRSSGEGPEDMFDEGNSLDLSPIKFGTTEQFDFDDGGFGVTDPAIDDTFHYRRHVKAVG